MSSNFLITKDMFLTLAEVAKLYNVLEDAKDLAMMRKNFSNHVRENYYIKTLLESGLRVFELCALRIGDLRENSLIVQHGKGDKKREVILTKSAQQLIRKYLKVKRSFLNEPTEKENFLFVSQWGKPFTTTGVRKRVKYWFAKCGFNKDLSCHTCRHTYVSHAIMAGVDVLRVKENAGHASLTTTTIYAHAVTSDLGDIEIYNTRSFANKWQRNLSSTQGS